MLKFAANLTMMFKEYDFLDRFEHAAKAGFNAVEFLWPYEYDKNELARIIKENNLKVALFNTTAGDVSKGQWGHAGLIGMEKEFKSEIETSLDYAIALDCKTIHVMSCVLERPWEKDLCKRTFIKNMRMAADLVGKYGINLTIEALCPEIKPGYLYHSQYETLDLCEQIAKENVFIQLDTFHAQMVDGNLSHLITKYAGKYGHVQVASVPYRNEPDEGEINYEYIFDLLQKVGYQGYIGLEYNPRSKTEDGLGFLKKYKNN